MNFNDIYKSSKINIIFFNKMKNNLIEQLEHYNKLSSHIKEINLLKSINNIECNFILKYNNNILNTKSKIEELIEQIDLINNYIINYCNHEWITDNIDTTPDNSLLITYCDICQTTKQNNK
jgi:hypothetical protein